VIGLILIAIIVAMFSQSGDESRSIRDLQKNIKKLQRTVDLLNTQRSSGNGTQQTDRN
jgi:hypothetical protein